VALAVDAAERIRVDIDAGIARQAVDGRAGIAERAIGRGVARAEADAAGVVEVLRERGEPVPDDRVEMVEVGA
jgi:hypothetical protein